MKLLQLHKCIVAKTQIPELKPVEASDLTGAISAWGQEFIIQRILVALVSIGGQVVIILRYC